MTRNDGYQRRLDRSRSTSPERSARKTAARLAFEPLETRCLMTTLPPTIQHVQFDNAGYTISVSGPGEVQLASGGKGLETIVLSGTTTSSTLTITQNATNSKYSGSLLAISGIKVNSGQIGTIDAQGANLVGSLVTKGSVVAVNLGSVGPAAQILAKGGLGTLDVSGAITLNRKGLINIKGDLTGGLQAGSITLNGGQILIGHNLASLTTGSVSITNNGLFSVGNNAGQVQVNGDTYLASGGSIDVTEDLTGLSTTRNVTIVPGGQIDIGRDVTGPLSIGGNVSITAGQIYVGRDILGTFNINGGLAESTGGNVTVARDLVGGLSTQGNLGLATGSYLFVGRNAGTVTSAGGSGAATTSSSSTSSTTTASGTSSTSSSSSSSSGPGLNVNGNLFTGAGGSILIGGNLNGLSVGGVIVGQGTAAIDLSVGLDLNSVFVGGGTANQGGVSNFNLNVVKNIDGLQVNHGIFNSFITAGVLLTNATVGPDGPIAVFDSRIFAGVQITNTTFTGDVVSDRPTNPTGGLTRIVAGEDRSGTFELGGNMQSVIITGSLINAVLAASVQPFGGNGTETTTIAAPPASLNGQEGTYNAPSGNKYIGQLYGSSNGGVPFAAPGFNRAIDPNVIDNVLPGTINPKFAPSPNAATTTTTTGSSTVTSTASTIVPSQSTVDGAVITTAHANGSDYAGIYAADTSGVYVGTLPAS